MPLRPNSSHTPDKNPNATDCVSASSSCSPLDWIGAMASDCSLKFLKHLMILASKVFTRSSREPERFSFSKSSLLSSLIELDMELCEQQVTESACLTSQGNGPPSSTNSFHSSMSKVARGASNLSSAMFEASIGFVCERLWKPNWEENELQVLSIGSF